jgi:hypothetical protein
MMRAVWQSLRLHFNLQQTLLLPQLWQLRAGKVPLGVAHLAPVKTPRRYLEEVLSAEVRSARAKMAMEVVLLLRQHSGKLARLAPALRAQYHLAQRAGIATAEVAGLRPMQRKGRSSGLTRLRQQHRDNSRVLQLTTLTTVEEYKNKKKHTLFIV